MAAHDNAVLSGHTLDKVTKAKVTIETFYSNLLNQQVEREERLSNLEKTMNHEDLPVDEVCIPLSFIPTIGKRMWYVA